MSSISKTSTKIDDNSSLELESYHPLIKKVLDSHKITSKDQAEVFLNPDYDLHTHDSALLKNSDLAADRLIKAIKDDEHIAIWSDYDSDGIPGAVLVNDVFRKVGFSNYEIYIPHRHNEGFGLNISGIDELAKNGTNLLLTIDCGIASFDAISHARGLGIDVIVTDHHELSGSLPDDSIVVNPKQPGCLYPEKMLCGAAVVFKLMERVLFKLREDEDDLNVKLHIPKPGWEKWLLDMVGLATLSDMVPLVGENRVLAKYGLFVLRKSPRVGLMKLLRKTKVNQRYLSEDDIGFTISPRINAASRMGVSRDAFLLLSTESEDEAEHYTNHLDEINNERKGVVASMVKEIKRHISEREEIKDSPVIVLGNPKWKPSLLGLAAGSIAEECQKPVFLWGRDGEGVLKGSCRAPEGFDILKIISSTPEGTFLQYGGHMQSGGFSISSEKVHFLNDLLSKSHDLIYKDEEKKENASALIHGVISPEEADWKLYSTIEKLGPFGVGNPKPLFELSNIELLRVEYFGKEKNHLKFVCKREGGKPIDAIQFFYTRNPKNKNSKELSAMKRVSITAHLEKSMFRNFPELRLRIVDIVE